MLSKLMIQTEKRESCGRGDGKNAIKLTSGFFAFEKKTEAKWNLKFIFLDHGCLDVD